MKNRLLVHACCAPCLVAVYDDLLENININDNVVNNIDSIDLIWQNINIHPKVEYEKRKETFVQYAKSLGKNPIIIDKYNMENFIKEAVGLDKTKYAIRCEYCYTSRLEEVFDYAKQNGYTHITTTLLISPYQKHDLIIKTCNKLAEKYNVEFYYKDYRPLFRKGQSKAKELGLYMQKYCGCVFSIDEGRWKLL